MIRTGNYSIASTCWIVLGVSLAALATVPLSHSDERIWLIGEPSPGMPTCDEFYDKWNAPGAPPGILAMAGYSREIFAAKDCLDKNDVPKACEHWSKLLVVLDKLGPPLNENRGDIEELMRQHNCESAPASDSEPAPKPNPSSECAPAKPAPETIPSPAPNSGSGPSPAPAE